MATTPYPSDEELKETFIPSHSETLSCCGVPFGVAIDIAETTGKRTYKDCWPPHILAGKGGPYRKCARRFSQILAEEAAGTACVVVPPLPSLPGQPSRWQEPSPNMCGVVSSIPHSGQTLESLALFGLIAKLEQKRSFGPG